MSQSIQDQKFVLRPRGFELFVNLGSISSSDIHTLPLMRKTSGSHEYCVRNKFSEDKSVGSNVLFVDVSFEALLPR